MNPAAEAIIRGWKDDWEFRGSKTFVFRGRERPCTVSDIIQDEHYGDGPPTEDIRCTITTPVWPVLTADANETTNILQDPGFLQDDAVLETADNDDMPPKPGGQVILFGRDYEISAVHNVGAGALWKLFLVSPN